MCMVSTTICFVSLSTVDFHLMPTICFWVTMWTAASRVLRLCVCYWPTRLSTQKTSSCWEVTTSAPLSIESTDSMMSARGGTISNFGKLSLTASTACLLPHLLTRRFCACTEALVQSWVAWIRSRESCVLLMCQILVYCAIFSGRIPTKMYKDGEKMIEESLSLLDKKLFPPSARNMTLTWFAVLTRW